MHFPLCIFDSSTPVDIRNEEELRRFASDCQLIEAAGGLVINERQQVLMIYRLDNWDFPKGKIEEGEDPATAALREVAEETGLHNATITGELPSTFHTYHLNGRKILKQTHWFAMRSTATEPLLPQLEEDIVKVEWVDIKDVREKLEHSYASLRYWWEGINSVETRLIASLPTE